MKLRLFSLIILSLLLVTSCKKFDDINTDPAKPEETDPAFLLANAEKRAADLIYGSYYNGRIGMHFAQYWTGTDKTSESRNLLTDDGLWAGLYAVPLMDLQGIADFYDRNPEKRNNQMLAVASIMKSWIYHNLTDLYVDVPYSQALQVDQYPQPMFDRAEDIYLDLLASLKTQINLLQETEGVITGDLLGRGNKEYWIKFANALRMRIALRMADVKPAEAKIVLEEAAQNTFESTDDDVFFPYDENSANGRYPYNDRDRDLIEFAVTSTLVDYMLDVEDPRLPIFARLDNATGQYRGKLYGTAENNPTMDSLSKPGVAVYSASMKGYLITYAEVAFIKAEAAARGMTMNGNAASLYEDAVKASMKQWGITDADAIDVYLQKVPYNAGNWKDVIGSQKWLALYNQGLQSWMERLRLDFKKPDGSALFVAPASGSLDPEVADVPQRLNYPNATRNSNTANCEAASQRIGGDSKATKNWWNMQ